MERVTISTAIETLNVLYASLVSGYWDASDVFKKDTIFDIIFLINAELNELNKLSIEDHLMHYEPITLQFPACTQKFDLLKSHLDAWFPRTETAQSLRESLSDSAILISPKQN